MEWDLPAWQIEAPRSSKPPTPDLSWAVKWTDFILHIFHVKFCKSFFLNTVKKRKITEKTNLQEKHGEIHFFTGKTCYCTIYFSHPSCQKIAVSLTRFQFFTVYFWKTIKNHKITEKTINLQEQHGEHVILQGNLISGDSAGRKFLGILHLIFLQFISEKQ